MRFVLQFLDFEITINQWWNGTPPIFVARDLSIIILVMLDITSPFFISIVEIIKKEEAIDWMIKYFIIISFVILFSWGILRIVIEQKAIVLISSKIQMDTHEFIKRHLTEDDSIITNIITLVLKWFSHFKLQIC